MKREEIDKLITESLSQEEATFYKDLDEENLFQGLVGVYKGKYGWFAVITTVVNFISASIAFYFGYKAFTSNVMIDMVQNGMVMFIAIVVSSMIKLWHWMQLDKNAIMREMKRLEYQVAVLTEKTIDKH